MSMKKVAIIGHDLGLSSTTAALIKSLEDKGHEVVVIDSPDEAKQLPFPKSEPLIIRNPYPIKEVMTGDFVCKGKHQYKEVNGQWICQCGRNIND